MMKKRKIKRGLKVSPKGGRRVFHFKKVLLFLMVVVLVGLGVVENVDATPQIEFVDPTLTDGNTSTTSRVEINVSITESNLGEMKFNWNGTNYTIYNDSLVLMYNFDNISAIGENDTHVVDISRYSNNGTVINASWDSTGKYGGAFSFDGNGDYIDASTFEPDEAMLDYTISVWIKPTSAAISSALTGVMGRGGPGESVATNLNNYINLRSGIPQVLYEYSSGGNDVGRKGTTTLQADTWYHLVGVRNDNAGTLLMYVNGVREDGTLEGDPANDPDSTADDFAIGRPGGFDSAYFNGTIDEVRIWNRTLTSEEIEESYMSNLYKYNTNKWALYVEQGEFEWEIESLANLNYTYQAFASNSSGNWNQTEERTVKVQAYDLRQGPMVGHTTNASTKIWARANDNCTFKVEYSTNSDLSSSSNSPAVLLGSSTDYTGSVNITGLSSNTTYYYSVILNGSRENSAPYPSFTTFPNKGDSVNFSFIFGSGNGPYAQRFPIYEAMENKNSSFMINQGDIIYADITSRTGTAWTLDEYRDKYRELFDRRYVDSFLENTITYNQWDDHEVVNNWNGKAYTTQYVNGSQAAEEYIYAHMPDYGNDVDGDKIKYYNFSYGDVDFFVLDCRSFRNNSASPDEMLGDTQKTWLKNVLGNSTAKFKIISSSVFFNNERTSDSWSSYPVERTEIFDYINDNNIAGVTLISGDAHWSIHYEHNVTNDFSIYEYASTPLTSNTGTNTSGDERILWSYGDAQVFGLVSIDTTVNPAIILFESYDVNGNLVLGSNFSYNENDINNPFDIINPIITITNPVNNSNFNTSSVTFNVSLSETGSWCGLSINGDANVTMQGSGTAFGYTNTSIVDGSHTFIVSCNDTANNYNASDSYNFYIDTVIPHIDFTDPTPDNESSQSNTNIFVNVSASDTASNVSTFIDFDKSLVGWWRMDDVNGSGDPTDYTGINNGTAVANAAQTDAGKLGKGFEFDGAGDYVSVSSSEMNNKSGTICAWAKYNYINTASGTDDYVFSRRTTAGDLLYLSASKVSNHSIGIGNVWGSTDVPIVKDQWMLLALTWDGTNYYWYKNGVERVSGSYGALNTLGSKIIIGAISKDDVYLDGYAFNGTIDDAMIFNRSLSAEEIYGLYANTTSKYVSNNFTGLAVGEHTFKAYNQDVAGNVNETELRTVTIDTTAPSITFSCSPTSVSTTGDKITCSCSATDAVDSSPTVSYRANPSTSSTGTFTTTCTATDDAGNSADLSISYTVSSAGGGGSGSYLGYVNTFVEDAKEFSEVGTVTKSLGRKNRVRIKINNQKHYIGVKELTTTNATIEVSSTPQEVVFNIGNEKKFDVTEDGYYDIYIKLSSINENKADLIIKSIHEEIPKEEKEVKKQEIKKVKFWLLILGLVVVIIAVVLIIRYKKKKR